MKKLFFCVILNALLASSCAMYSPFYVGNRFGYQVSYGEGRHPGIDFDVGIGTPVIAASDGRVDVIDEPNRRERYGGGFYVRVFHGEVNFRGENFYSVYMHLSKFFVESGQPLKRGQLIGLSGADNGGYPHLHFSICKIGGRCQNYSDTYDPDKFWLGSRQQCFDPNKDYSNYSYKELTLPVACGDYAKELKSKTKKKD